jgi:hypothetical protein
MEEIKEIKSSSLINRRCRHLESRRVGTIRRVFHDKNKPWLILEVDGFVKKVTTGEVEVLD